MLLVTFKFLKFGNVLTSSPSFDSWRRGLRRRLLHLKMNVPLKLTGVPRRIFPNPPIMLSIGGCFFGTRLFLFILTTMQISDLSKALISWNLETASYQSNALLTGNILSFCFVHIVLFSFPFRHRCLYWSSFSRFIHRELVVKNALPSSCLLWEPTFSGKTEIRKYGFKFRILPG